MKIRIWKLGCLDKGIFPGPSSYAKFASLLRQCGGKKEDVDLVWDDALKVETVEVEGDGLVNLIMPDVGDANLLAEATLLIERLLDADTEEKMNSSYSDASAFLHKVQKTPVTLR